MAFKSLNKVTTTGAGEPLTFTKLWKDHTVQVTTTGAPTAVTIDLEGSLDNATFFVLASHVFTAGELTDSKAMFHVIDKVVRNVRLNLSTLTGGSSPTVTALYEGFENRG